MVLGILGVTDFHVVRLYRARREVRVARAPSKIR